ncbi:MAG: tol-pal system protein YbgF [Candidatus Zixiibacteriota bacterium]
MQPRARRGITAILLMAVLYVAVSLAGCATPRMVNELKAQVTEVEAQNRQTQAMVTRLDSLLTEEMESNKRLRNEMNVTVSDLQRQIATLLENNNDLMHRIEVLMQQMYEHPPKLRSSPGALDTIPDTGIVPTAPAIDCQMTYDESFILYRQGEYEKAIGGFQNFLAHCASHELAENAYYWTGECYYSMEKYDLAIEQFKHLISTFKSSVNASRALYKLGRSHQELGRKEEAQNAFRRIIDEYPGTLEAEQARERLKDLK